MGKRWLLRCKYLLALASLLLFAAANASEITKDTVPRRFGVGIAYGFKDRVKGMVHPIELTVRYKLSDRHSLYMNVPFGWREWGWKSAVYPFTTPRSREDCTHKMRLYGLGFGYDYSILTYQDVTLFTGGGLEYQRLNYRYKEEDEVYDIFVPPGPIRLFNSFGSAKFNDFAIYPKVGLRYTYRFVGIEFDYRYYVSKRGMHEYYSGGLFSYEFVHDTRLSPAFHCGVYFLF